MAASQRDRQLPEGAQAYLHIPLGPQRPPSLCPLGAWTFWGPQRTPEPRFRRELETRRQRSKQLPKEFFLAPIRGTVARRLTHKHRMDALPVSQDFLGDPLHVDRLSPEQGASVCRGPLRSRCGIEQEELQRKEPPRSNRYFPKLLRGPPSAVFAVNHPAERTRCPASAVGPKRQRESAVLRFGGPEAEMADRDPRVERRMVGTPQSFGFGITFLPGDSPEVSRGNRQPREPLLNVALHDVRDGTSIRAGSGKQRSCTREDDCNATHYRLSRNRRSALRSDRGILTTASR